MLAAHVARERSVEQYTKLFKATSDGFSLIGVSGNAVGVHNSLVEYKFTKA
jgi:preprotein translocase subunit Sss1